MHRVAYRMWQIPAKYSRSCDTCIAGEGEGREIGARPNFGGLLILAPRLLSTSISCLSIASVLSKLHIRMHAYAHMGCIARQLRDIRAIDDLDVRATRAGIGRNRHLFDLLFNY